jgi:hypothetical protein
MRVRVDIAIGWECVIRIGGREGLCGREVMPSTSSSEDDNSTTSSSIQPVQDHMYVRVDIAIGPSVYDCMAQRNWRDNKEISFAIWPIRSYITTCWNRDL